MSLSLRRILSICAIFLALWLSFKYLLGLALPFLLGTVLALMAEPAVALCQKRLKLPRGVCSALGVTGALALGCALLLLAGALIFRELQALARALPDMQQAAQSGLASLQDRLLTLADTAPQSLQPLAQKAVLSLFDDTDGLARRAAGQLPAMVGGMLSRVPGGALGIGTGLLAGYMISARLPAIRLWLSRRLPDGWRQKTLPALNRVRSSLWGWIKAQGKLALVTFLILTAGFFLLKIPYAPLWAALIALVDAVPVLGTGTVLLPWAAILLLQGKSLPAIGLLLIYTAALLTRTVLEPRLVGKQLGLDPLVTLVCFYLGFRLWGVAGMLLAPLLAATAKALSEQPA